MIPLSTVVVSLFACAFAQPALAQERWHEQPITALPAGPTIDDMAFHVDEGYLAVRGSDLRGYVVRMSFPPDGPPVFEDTAFPFFTYSIPLLVGFHGTHVTATTESDDLGLLDVSAGVWDTTTLSAPAEFRGVSLWEPDTAGGARFLYTPLTLGGNEPNVHFYDGAAWTGHDAASFDQELQVVLLASPWAAGISKAGRLLVAADVASLPVNGAWSDVGVVLPAVSNLPEDGSAAWLGGGAMAAVSAGAGGSFAAYIDGLGTGSVVVTDCSAEVMANLTSLFRRVATADGVLYALDRAGRVHRIEDPTVCANWTTATVSPTSFNEGVGLGAVSGDIAVAVGQRPVTEEPIVVWRNRAPLVDAGADLTLDDGATTTITMTLNDPDPADATLLTVDVVCDDPALSTNVSGPQVELSAAATTPLCPADAPLVVTCEATASDGEKVSPTDSFTVFIHGIDDDAPVTQPLVLSRAFALPDDPVTVSVQATDCVSPLTVTWEVRADDDGSLAHTSVDDTPPYEAAFPAPEAAVGGGQRAYTVTAFVSDGAHTSEESAALTVIGVIPRASLGVCPGTVTAGASADFTLVLDDVVPFEAWDLTLTADAGEDDFPLVVEQPTSVPVASVTPPRCHPDGSFTGTWSAWSGFGEPQTLTCPNETQIVSEPSHPSLSRQGDEDPIPVYVGAEGVDHTLSVLVEDDCADENTVTWDLSSLPRVLWPSSSSEFVERGLGPTFELSLSAGPEVAGQLLGVVATVSVVVEPEDGAEPLPAVTFTLRFVAAASTAVNVTLTGASPRALDLGDVTRVDAQISSSVPFALPSLSVELLDGDLALLDDTVEIASSSCGATGRVSKTESGVVIEAEGVRAGCPLSFGSLARKGLAREALRVGRCTWGTEALSVGSCTGEMVVSRPRALGCAQTERSSSSLFALLLALASLRRVRRTRGRPA